MNQIAVTLFLLIALTAAAPILKKNVSRRRYLWILIALGILYMAGNLYFTLLSRTPAPRKAIEPVPFATYGDLFRRYVSAEKPSGSLLSILLFGIRPIDEMILNMILYYPFGYILSALFHAGKAYWIVISGILTAACIELAQFVFQLGWCNMDDLINNTLGCIIGVLVWRVQTKQLVKQKIRKNKF